MNLPPFFWSAIKRERIHARVVLDVGDNINGPLYDHVGDFGEDDSADDVAARVKDGIWASIPGEQSA